MRKIGLLLLVFTIFVSCQKDRRTEDEMIDDFITENDLQGFFTDSGLFVSIENPRTGEKPTEEDEITVHYEGKYVQDSELFDTSLDRDPVSFKLSQVISGWQEGLQYFSEGDEGWLVMPANLAYGSFPPAGVRANAPMAFSIELISIQ